MIPITGSMLYSYALCPHRVALDLFGDPAKRDRVSAIVKTKFASNVIHQTIPVTVGRVIADKNAACFFDKWALC